MATNTPRTVEAVQKTCRIINELQRRGETGITELSEDVEYSKSTIHGHLATLVDEGLVIKNNQKYRLSLRFLDIAESVKNRVTDYEIVHDQVRELAEETGEVVHFGAEENGRVVYIAKWQGAQAVQTKSRIGKQMPMHSTSLGKAILAEYGRDRVDEIVEQHGLEARTQNTLTRPSALHDNLQEITQRGYSVDDEENILGIRCIGIPVSISEAGVIGALSISGPSQRMTDDRIKNDLREKIAQAANVIEVNSRYS
ncbi:IclR family transcriptional regulator [Haloarcula marina]|uniref:IclR family transcriptional regulator n=1 Tax=Haloarcula marina TaxID=2961574 RepID=UPI0020B6FD68|nr:IclR family transcriptional regulator [Halomicroarcula marina]